MADTLLDYTMQLAAAMNEAGLDARIVSDPDRGAGVVIGAPRLDYANRPARTGCQQIAMADVDCMITVIGAGWAVEQVEQLLIDATTAFYAVPVPWSPETCEADSSVDAPLYRITVRR